MNRIIVLIILLIIGCSERYDTSIQDDNRLLGTLIFIQQNNTTVNNYGSGGNSSGSYIKSNRFVLVSINKLNDYTYYDAVTACNDINMYLISSERFPDFINVMNLLLVNPSSATSDERQLFNMMNGRWYRYWVTDMVGDGSIADVYETKALYPLKIEKFMIKNKTEKYAVALCFK